MRTVLPDPFAPATTAREPGASEKATSASAVTSSKRFTRPWTETAAPAAVDDGTAMAGDSAADETDDGTGGRRRRRGRTRSTRRNLSASPGRNGRQAAVNAGARDLSATCMNQTMPGI